MKPVFRMHFLLMLLFGLLLSGIACNQDSGNGIKERKVTSAILDKEVTLTVRLPDGYNASQKQYTALYFLHGNKEMVEEIASMSQKMHTDKNTPEIIVVGIDVSGEKLDRMTDHTKYDKFLSSMEQELKPAIEKQYRTNGQSILFERSLSGSLALYALLTQPTLFNGYIAASKQWYEENNNYFTELAGRALQNPVSFKNRKIFLATLNGAYNNNNIQEVDEQMQAFSAMLTSKSGRTILAKYQAFDDWGIEPEPGFNEGLLFVSTEEKPGSPLTMTQTADGKWVIMDSQKTALYEVFIYDNGPDYEAEGLIRVIKNGKIGYADAKTYAIVIEPQFDCAFPFENGKAKVSNQCKTVKDGEYSVWESNAWRLVDKKGRLTPE